MTLDLDAYLKRIAYDGPLDADVETLNALHEAHINAVPFENLDVHAGRPVTFSLEDAYDEIVTRAQGGWCFEMNAVFGWALSEIGFDVMRIGAGVRRASLGDEALGNHLALIVRLDRDYLVDVGFGSSQLTAIALEEGVTSHSPLRMALARTEDGYWRLHEGGPGAVMSYDFRAEPANEAQMAASHAWQCTDPNSIFYKTLSAKIRRGSHYFILRGRMLETQMPGRSEQRILDSPVELSEVLSEIFGLEEPELERLWPKICARHKQLFPHASRQSGG
ncbi:arylamine N-acetyltransferase family protein [Henriciella litoralis]|uniref:arylamine N-acetyltransferase family protein n=1 Tax=Henriciella litoralis TaxID=568102 RepID=UPI000A05A63A|nr:arylamine N-acetyltransferase [Henriciella litoralis]